MSIQWEHTLQTNGSLWAGKVAHLSTADIREIVGRMSRDPNQRNGTILQLHWCDGFVELSVETQLHGECRDGYVIDIDSFWTAADLEDLDAMDAELSRLRDAATE